MRLDLEKSAAPIPATRPATEATRIASAANPRTLPRMSSVSDGSTNENIGMLLGGVLQMAACRPQGDLGRPRSGHVLQHRDDQDTQRRHDECPETRHNLRGRPAPRVAEGENRAEGCGRNARPESANGGSESDHPTSPFELARTINARCNGGARRPSTPNLMISQAIRCLAQAAGCHL